MPADLFLAGSTATFPHEKREQAVYFEYAQTVQDALRVNFLKGFDVEAVPTAGRYGLPKIASYDMNVVSSATSFTTRRNYLFGDFLIPKAQYGELRSFYSQMENKDQESVVLKVAQEGAAGEWSEAG